MQCEMRHLSVFIGEPVNPSVVSSSLTGAAMIADEKAARQKNHEKQYVFHGFLLFKHRKRAFMKSEAKIIF